MRTMLLSFKAEVFDKLVAGRKIYEHRKVFPSEPIKAYLYVSSPVKAVSGIIVLNNKTDMEEWKIKYSYDQAAVIRIEDYLLKHRYAMEISEFQQTEGITLEQLRMDLPGFVVPQMYYYIDNTPLLDYLETHLTPIGEKTTNDFSNIDSTMICVN